MAYSIEVGPRARRDLKKLPRQLQKSIAKSIEGLSDNPRPNGCEKVSGIPTLDVYKIRDGDYRILYTIMDEHLVVILITIRDRREVYERLQALVPGIEDVRRRLSEQGGPRS